MPLTRTDHPLEPLSLLVLLVGGLVSGVINSIAGGGSFLTLPLLIFVGLPPTVANATNRVAVAVQSLAGVAGFDDWATRLKGALSRPTVPNGEVVVSSSRIPWPIVGRTLAPTLAGSLVGAIIASRVSDEVFLPILGALLLFMSGVVALRPARWFPASKQSHRSVGIGLTVAFFFAGIYGGFIQAGVGFILLAFLVPTLGLDLIRANGVKVALIHMLTVVALLVFVSAGQIDWKAGAILAVGNGAGGYIGARLAIRLGEPWIRWVVFAVAIVCALEILGVRSALLTMIA